MADLKDAYDAQIRNVQTKTGRSIPELNALLQQSGLTKHGELRAMFMRELGLGHGDANSLVHYLRKSDGQRAAEAQGASTEDVVGELYAGAKAPLRPIHDRLMAAILEFGAFEILPKKGYVSLRRKKQFAMIGPATNTRVEVGLNMKGVAATDRLVAMPAGGMCQYKVKVSHAGEVDGELIRWVKHAFDSAG